MKVRHIVFQIFVCAVFWYCLFCIVFATAARAETGLDVLGLAKHNAKMIAQEIDNGTAIGVLDSTFGDPYPALGALIQSGKVSSYRVHLRDFTCYRGNRCQHGVPSQSDTAPIRDAARRLAAFQGRFPSTPCYVSPALEHDVKDRKVVEKWYAILKRVVPQCIPVCSAFTGYCPASGVLVEKHGNSGKADIRSNDGNSLFDSDSANYRTSGRVLTLGWINEFNGRVSGEKEFIPPLKRVNWADRALVRQVVRVMREPEPAPRNLPAGCRKIVEPELLKTNAEYYGKGKDDGRGNKNLFISRKKYDRIDVTRLDGKSVGCLRYFGPFDGGGFRSYMGSCSRQTPVGLMDQLGSEWGLLRAGKECWLFNAIRRQGYYR